MTTLKACLNYSSPMLLTFLLLAAFFSSCAKYRIPTEHFAHCRQEKQVLQHPLYKIVPRHRCQLVWYDLGHWATWALLGNDDDGIFGEGANDHFNSIKPSASSACAWWLRNPLHNFTFYLIGSAHRKNSEIDLLRLTPYHCSFGCRRYPGKTLFACKRHSGLYIALHGGKPFISLRLFHCKHRKSDFYFGWRERGNFGIKIHPFSKA